MLVGIVRQKQKLLAINKLVKVLKNMQQVNNYNKW